jgi:hypothetical protein
MGHSCDQMRAVHRHAPEPAAPKMARAVFAGHGYGQHRPDDPVIRPRAARPLSTG